MTIQPTSSSLPPLRSDLANTSHSDRLMSQGNDLNAAKGKEADDPLREAFRDFVGQTFFGQMIASMRSTQNEPAYFHGGQAEKIFQGQLDQQLSQTLSEKSASKIADPMFELFRLKQR